MNAEVRIEQRCPYVGLQPFEEADRAFFFGRERDQRVIIANLLSSPLTILYGSSGVGKSSVLMAGVVPQLHRERPRTAVVVFRNWVDLPARADARLHRNRLGHAGGPAQAGGDPAPRRGAARLR